LTKNSDKEMSKDNYFKLLGTTTKLVGAMVT
jgi:hypothetical protein